MAQENPDEEVLVESCRASNTSGKHGEIHIRPVACHKYPATLQVACSKELSRDYPVGTRFLLIAKLTDREKGGEYLYSHPRWKANVIR
jgi:hypothetical protein